MTTPADHGRTQCTRCESWRLPEDLKAGACADADWCAEAKQHRAKEVGEWKTKRIARLMLDEAATQADVVEAATRFAGAPCEAGNHPCWLMDVCTSCGTVRHAEEPLP